LIFVPKVKNKFVSLIRRNSDVKIVNGELLTPNGSGLCAGRAW